MKFLYKCFLGFHFFFFVFVFMNVNDDGSDNDYRNDNYNDRVTVNKKHLIIEYWLIALFIKVRGNE